MCSLADITFLALHGEEGENGQVQATLDLHGIRYTGCGYLGSALAMNKRLSKELFEVNNIPTPDGFSMTKSDGLAPETKFPCVVKPCSGGSSVGTSIVHNEEEYAAALALAFRYENEVLVEEYVRGMELTVGVMDGIAMPVIQIKPKSGFYDYKNKYQPGATDELCPAPISGELTHRVQRLAEQVNGVLNIETYCRVDFLYDEDADIIYCLEANTLPGMTPTSLIPLMARAMGLSFADLCQKILDVSMNKYKQIM